MPHAAFPCAQSPPQYILSLVYDVSMPHAAFPCAQFIMELILFIYVLVVSMPHAAFPCAQSMGFVTRTMEEI